MQGFLLSFFSSTKEEYIIVSSDPPRLQRSNLNGSLLYPVVDYNSLFARLSVFLSDIPGFHKESHLYWIIPLLSFLTIPMVFPSCLTSLPSLQSLATQQSNVVVHPLQTV